jgi:hypothetical protein
MENKIFALSFPEDLPLVPETKFPPDGKANNLFVRRRIA